MSVVSTERLADVFVELADTLVDDFDVIEFLLMVTHRTAELIGDADVGLLLADQRGQLQFMAASNEGVKRLELFQVQVHEGPCFDAFQSAAAGGERRASGMPQDRWPRFAPRAVEAGYRAVHAFPLRLRQDVIGAIGVFGTTDGEVGDHRRPHRADAGRTSPRSGCSRSAPCAAGPCSPNSCSRR